jgi:hypothetical protein
VPRSTSCPVSLTWLPCWRQCMCECQRQLPRTHTAGTQWSGAAALSARNALQLAALQATTLRGVRLTLAASGARCIHSLRSSEVCSKSSALLLRNLFMIELEAKWRAHAPPAAGCQRPRPRRWPSQRPAHLCNHTRSSGRYTGTAGATRKRTGRGTIVIFDCKSRPLALRQDGDAQSTNRRVVSVRSTLRGRRAPCHF